MNSGSLVWSSASACCASLNRIYPAGRPAELLQPFLSLQATIDLDGSLAEGSAILLAQPGACERARKRSNWNWDDGESLGVLRHVQKAKLHSVGNVVLKSDAFRSSRVGCSLFS